MLDDQNVIPVIDLSDGSLKPGTEKWVEACRRVRDACERMGCFRVVYDGLPASLRESMFEALRLVFQLPVETKKTNTNTKPYFGYNGDPVVVPLYESLGVEEAGKVEAANAFTELMWPAGNPKFCHVVNSTSKKMLELDLVLTKMIFESFGAEKHLDSFLDNRNSLLRVMKYKPPEREDMEIGLPPHSDKNMLTILCQDDTEGLQLLSSEGEWLDVTFSGGSFAVIIGETFKIWSNGRLQAPKHRVMMRGMKERYSFGMFTMPKEGYIMEVPAELVDLEHPLLFKPFNFMEFICNYYSSSAANPRRDFKENVVEVFARI